MGEITLPLPAIFLTLIFLFFVPAPTHAGIDIDPGTFCPGSGNVSIEFSLPTSA
jgi:hypothetical protein